jgi:hypothetical protein
VTFESDLKLTRIEDEAFSYCTALRTISIPSTVEVICRQCFIGCSSLSSLAFESDSNLAGIGNAAFFGCGALKSISIPQSIQKLENEWYNGSSLATVIFESGVSLVNMIAAGEVDLEGGYAIYLDQWDGLMDFPGYSVSPIPFLDRLVQLVKN